MQLQHSAAVMRGEGCKLASGMSTAGFGMPATAAQFSLRIASKALAGSEVLASYQGGFERAAEQINQAQYVVAKAFLGIPASASVGSRAAVLAETRLLIRAGTMIAQRIAMARARISLLPVHHPTSLAVQCIQLGHVQETWWQHSQLVVSEYLQVPEIWHCPNHGRDAQLGCRAQARIGELQEAARPSASQGSGSHVAAGPVARSAHRSHPSVQYYQSGSDTLEGK